MRPVLRALEVLSVLEVVSILVLLLNITTIHLRPLSATIGPIHGALYLTVAVTALFARRLRFRTRVCALVPVIGGALTLINVRAENRTGVRVRSTQSRRLNSTTPKAPRPGDYIGPEFVSRQGPRPKA